MQQEKPFRAVGPVVPDESRTPIAA
jgi:hypothetical protein